MVAGAFDGEPAAIAVRLASRIQGSPPARILGSSQKTSADFAAFANTVLVRYLDCNDTYAARGTGHPSDMIPGVLAVCAVRSGSARRPSSRCRNVMISLAISSTRSLRPS